MNLLLTLKLLNEKVFISRYIEWQPTNNMPIEPMSKAFEAKIGSAQQLSIYPNPVSHSAQVVISNFSGTASIEIYDINGRLVKEFNTQEVESTINVSTFANGIYIIKAKAEGQIFTQKLSVIH